MYQAMETNCVVCGSSASSMCQRCGESYCSDVCQHKDWKNHKYICTLMPALVAKEEKLVQAKYETVPVLKKATNPSEAPLDYKSQSCNNRLKVVSEPLIKLSQEWRSVAMPAVNEFFKFRVSHMEPDGSIWVLQMADTEQLQCLTTKIARNMLNKKHCNIDQLSVGDLVAVDIDGLIFRGEVRLINGSVSKCDVLLIDYGSVISCNANDIYCPVQCMSEHKSFALRVKLPTNTGVQVNNELTLRLLGSKTADGIEQVQLKPKMTIPLNLAVEKLAINPEVSVAQFLQHDTALNEPQVALLQIKLVNSLNEDLNARLSDKPVHLFAGFPDEIHTFYLAAKTNQGFRRALLLDYIKQPQLFLVYEMDEGRISICNEVCRIPSELLGHSLQVFAVTLQDDGNLKQLLSKCGKDLSIKFQMDSLPRTDQEQVRVVQASLVANNKTVCAVRANTFQGQVADLGLKYWRKPIENGNMVYITHVTDFSEICISSVRTKAYDNIFKHLNSKCQRFMEISEISKGSIVLVVPPNHGIYRAEITGVDNKKFTVVNIDTGSTHTVHAEWLRKSCRFLENLPVSLCRAKISTLYSLPRQHVPANTCALALLMKLFNHKAELQVKFVDYNLSVIDLLEPSAEPQSVMERMLPVVFTPVAVELKPAQNPLSVDLVASETMKTVPKEEGLVSNYDLPPLPLSPPTTPIPQEVANNREKRHYFDDVERQLIPLGKEVQLLILHVENLHKTGYITGCHFADEKVAEKYHNFIGKVATTGATDNKLPLGYLPDVNEMCLCRFSEDDTWYRGVCERVTGQKALIRYFDFGNSEIVPLERIKPIPEELLKDVYATKCFVDGFDETKDFTILEEYLVSKGKISVSVLNGPEPNTRLINIPKMDKVLAQELI